MSEPYTLYQQKERAERLLKCKTPVQLASLLGVSFIVLRKNIIRPVYRRQVINNKGGRTRILHIPGPKLKMIQRRLNDYLQAVYCDVMPDEVHGFVRCPDDSAGKRNIVTNALPHVGKKYILSMDLFRFFPSVRAKMVREVFLRKPFQWNLNLASALALLCTYRHSLPTGSPVSPVVSNFACLDLDAALTKLAKGNGFTYTRYADDLTFSGDTLPETVFQESVAETVRTFGFNLNRRKIRIQKSTFRQRVTGIIVNQKPNVDRRFKRLLRAQLHAVKALGPSLATFNHLKKDDLAEADVQKHLLSLEGKKSFTRMVDNYLKPQ